jgi:hypothetical protein
MIRHIFAGTIQNGVTQTQVEELLQAWNALPGKIPEIVSFTAGKNLGLVNNQISVALVADFENEKDWKTYMEHPAHLAISQNMTSKIIDPSSRVAAQIKTL